MLFLTMMFLWSSGCSSTVPLFENTGAGSLDQILVAQVGSGAGRGGAHDDQDKKHARKRPVAM